MSILRWFKREPVLTHAELNYAVSLMQQDIARQITNLRNSVEAAIKTYKCIICGADFARLPAQSDKRCPACQRDIKATGSPAIAQGNSGHRSAGHNTRGIHKKAGA